jgi:hypothetical protein
LTQVSSFVGKNFFFLFLGVYPDSDISRIGDHKSFRICAIPPRLSAVRPIRGERLIVGGMALSF